MRPPLFFLWGAAAQAGLAGSGFGLARFIMWMPSRSAEALESQTFSGLSVIDWVLCRTEYNKYVHHAFI